MDELKTDDQATAEDIEGLSGAGDVPAGHVLRQSRLPSQPTEWVQVAREEETRVSRLQRMLNAAVEKLTDWLRPQSPDGLPIPTQLAQALTDRVSLDNWLSYRDFDEERNLTFMTAADTFRAGFVLGFSPLLVAGTDVETQLEAVLTNCPPDTVVQVGVLAGSQTQHILDAWLQARLRNNHHPVLAEIALRRAEYFRAASEHGGSLTLEGSSFQPRKFFYYLSVSLPYNGAPDDEGAMDIFLKNVTGLRSTIEGALKGASIPSATLNREAFEFLLNELLNPQLTPQQRRERLANNSMGLPESLIDRESRITVEGDGNIRFSSHKEGATDVVATVLTMDAPPVEGWLPNTSKLMGHPLSRDDRISCPFWLHTTMLVQHPDKAKDRITMKLGSLNKQMMSESPWYRSMMGHLYTQKAELDGLLEATRGGHAPMRVWSGVVLYNTPERVKRDTEYVANLWRKAGFRCSPERYISLPVFLAGLPLMYDPVMDPPGRGLQRANTINSFNAATLMHVQGDWQGSAPMRGGPMLVSRRGQLATIDLFDTSSNFNFVVVAKSGSGKSFFANELAVDFLSRNGVVRIFDVGGSYKRFASVMDGTVLEFDPENPVSLNPYSGINTHGELFELMPMLKSLIRQMAFPLSTDESMETKFNWEYQAIEQAITAAWETHREATGLEHVYHWMNDQADARYKDIAFQLYPYAVGRYAKWFNGPRQVELDNDLIIVELEHLEVDPDLQAVVMTLMIHQITKDMYLSDPERKRPKLLLVDEGWRLLGDKQSGGFISKAFRTVRKYRGCAGAITQSFADFATSAAARAALENSAWKFVLKQEAESIDFAVDQKWVSDDETLVQMLKTVNSDRKQGFSEVFVKSESGQGVYRFVTDRHSYWLYTSDGADLNRLAEVQHKHGFSLLEAVDYLAREDYLVRGHTFRPHEGGLLEKLFAVPEEALDEA
ncbi:type IV secretion system protein TraC [Burkholderia sp. Bp9125]|nr:type IV secretion system protein TraC [Burkholderia sp. Bp9125]